jgi:UDP-N-acetylglucosamine 2-epimerase (non-hydrolysing)
MDTNNFENVEIPWEYQVKDVSSKIIRVIQSYTSIVNKVIWDK